LAESLILLDNISLAFGLDKLLDSAKLQISSNERVCLIGQNGAGKSSLLKIIADKLQHDAGTIWRKPHLRVSYLDQAMPTNSNHTVYEFVAEGLSEDGKLLTSYHNLINEMANNHSESTVKELEKLQQKIDARNSWQLDQKIQVVLDKLKLNADVQIQDLSGGWQRRVSLAKALVSDPELLILDEPTNHLDIDTITWLEDQLFALNIGILFVTHDRSLVKRLATRIIELDRGDLTAFDCSYERYLDRKVKLLLEEENQNKIFDKKLQEEEVWIRQGIKARRTRNEGRVRELEKLRIERSKRREIKDKVKFNLDDTTKSGKKVIEFDNVTYKIAGKTLIKDFSLPIMRSDRIGLIGPNGVGKSTFINLLLEKLTPDSGEIKVGTNLKIAYFDQLRETLDLEKTVKDNVSEGSDFIEINGRRQHLIGYLKDFQFTAKRALTPVKALSGGERNRILLAKLFAKPANFLILDEPTNDLDIETLELLEELLTKFKGTIILVSHDREFLDNIVTSTLVFEGEGKITEYIGGYKDYIAQKKLQVSNKKETKTKPLKSTNEKPKKLSFKEQQELKQIPKKIEDNENKQQKLQDLVQDPGFYQKEQDEVNKVLQELAEIDKELNFLYERWDELDKN